MLVLNLQDACWLGFSVCEKLQEPARRKLWLLAGLSGILGPFGVKIVCGRAFSETSFFPERPCGTKDLFSLHWAVFW